MVFMLGLLLLSHEFHFPLVVMFLHPLHRFAVVSVILMYGPCLQALYMLFYHPPVIFYSCSGYYALDMES